MKVSYLFILSSSIHPKTLLLTHILAILLHLLEHFSPSFPSSSFDSLPGLFYAITLYGCLINLNSSSLYLLLLCSDEDYHTSMLCFGNSMLLSEGSC